MTDYALQGLGAIPCDVSLLPKENKTRTAKLLGHRNAQAHGGHLKFSRCQSENALSPKSRRREVPKSIVFKCFLCIYICSGSQGGANPYRARKSAQNRKRCQRLYQGIQEGVQVQVRGGCVRGLCVACGACVGGCGIGTGSALGGV